MSTMTTPTLTEVCRRASPAALDEFVRTLARFRPSVQVRSAYLTARRVRAERRTLAA